MKKLGMLLLGIGVGVGMWVWHIRNWPQRSLKEIQAIGILQTISHPALDLAREGFMEEMGRAYGESVAFVVQNAEGIQSQAHGIAKSFHSNPRISAIYAIGTLALQSAMAMETKKPIFFSAVSDPASLGVLKAFNVCGISDRIDVRQQIERVLLFFPKARVLSVLYHPTELNSTGYVKQMEQAIQGTSLRMVPIGVHDQAEISVAVQAASRQGDVVMIPLDNLLVSSMPLIAGIAQQFKKPVIASDPPSAKQGAVLAFGVDYLQAGRQSALACGLPVLREKKNPNEIPVSYPETVQIHGNKKQFTHFGLSVPQSMKEHMVWVP